MVRRSDHMEIPKTAKGRNMQVNKRKRIVRLVQWGEDEDALEGKENQKGRFSDKYGFTNRNRIRQMENNMKKYT